MKIVLDCPGCGKRYEVDAALAGKKSRCKDCGNTFRIPNAPATSSAVESTPRRASPAADREPAAFSGSVREPTPAVYAEVVAAPSSPAIIASGAARGTIVFNCPRCFKRYEVDRALAGKKSRCKDCKEVFTIPQPLTAPEPEPVEPMSTGKRSSLSGRNFAVIPEEVVPEAKERFEFEADDEPAAPAMRRAPLPLIDDEPVQLGPRRTAYPRPGRRSSRREEVDTEVGVTVAGFYAALAILGFIILAIWHAAGEPGADRVSRVFAVSVVILCFLGVVMATWANIWLLVIAFRDKIEQGLFCLLVPLYTLLYIFMRWRETRGIFAMTFAPFLVVISFALFGGYLLGLKGPTTLVNNLGDRLESLAPDLSEKPNQNKQAAAEVVFRDYIRAVNRLTEACARIDSASHGGVNRAEFQAIMRNARSAQKDLELADRAAISVKLNRVDLIAVKKAAGPEMRAAIIALKQQFIRIASSSNNGSQLTAEVAEVDRMLAAWEASDDASTNTTVADLFPRAAVNRDGSAGAMVERENPPGPQPDGPPPGFPPGGMPPGFPPAGPPRRRFETFDAHFERMRGQYGDQAVMVAVVGLPTNSDPAVGVTKHDVEVAIDQRLKALAPEASQSMSFGSGGERSMCLISVDDVKRLAESIDFGKASRNGNRIDVVVSREYIASVPRLPAQPSLAARPHNPRDDGLKIPAGADIITRSLIQLKSADMGQMKEALKRLTLVRPDDRAKEVLAAVLPLLEQPDEDLVKHAVRVLAVWQSPDAMARLIDLIHDPRVFLRHEVIKTLGKYDDTKAAEAIISRFKDDGFQAEPALTSMGAAAEPPLIALLRHPDEDLRRKACNILKFVGGSATLKAMSKIPPDPDIGVRRAAHEAIAMIRLRVNAADDSDEPAKKKSDPPPAAKSRKKS